MKGFFTAMLLAFAAGGLVFISAIVLHLRNKQAEDTEEVYKHYSDYN